MVELSVILPAYNEEENLKRFPKELIPELDKLVFLGKKVSYEIIIVDDGSTDNTYKAAKTLAQKYSTQKYSTSKAKANIGVIKHVHNIGLGAAVRTGIRAAAGKLTITLDSDLTFHPKLIKNLLKRFEKGDVDLVIGSPALDNRGYNKSIPFYRIFLSKSCNLIYNILLWKRITAVSPIFRLYKTKMLKKLRLKSTGFDINAEILVKLLHKHARIAEIPAQLTTRKYGASSLDNRKEIMNHLRMYWKIIKWNLRVGNK